MAQEAGQCKVARIGLRSLIVSASVWFDISVPPIAAQQPTPDPMGKARSLQIAVHHAIAVVPLGGCDPLTLSFRIPGVDRWNTRLTGQFRYGRRIGYGFEGNRFSIRRGALF